MSTPPMPTSWTPANLNPELYGDLIDLEPQVAWSRYMQRRMGGAAASAPQVELTPELRAQIAEMGIDPSQFEELAPDALQEALRAVDIQAQPPQPPPNEAAPRVQEAGDNRLFGWPIREGALLWNPLSSFWNMRAVREKPLRIVHLAHMYVIGMVGYTVALPFRVVAVVTQLFTLLATIGKRLYHIREGDFFRPVKGELLSFAGVTGELLSGLVGIACPVAAYWFDEKIQENSSIHARSSVRGMRLDVDSFFNRGEFSLDNLGDFIQDAASSPRIQRKRELLSSLEPHMEGAVTKLKEYYTDDAVAATGVLTLENIALIGSLYALRQNRASSFLAPMQAYLQEYNLDPQYQGFERAYQAIWGTLSDDQKSHYIDLMVLKAVHDTAEDMEPEDIILAPDALQDLPENFEPLYDAMAKMNRAVIATDNEFYQVIGYLAGLR